MDADADTVLEIPRHIVASDTIPGSALPFVSAVAEIDGEGQLTRALPVSKPPPPKADAPMPQIGPYTLKALFRSSPFAQVFLAHKESRFGMLHSAVVKWVPRDHAEFETCREMLIDEGRAMALIEHASVVKVLDLEELPRGVYLAMEYVSGPDLRTVLDALAHRGERLPFTLSAFLVSSILRGLHHAHFTVDFTGTAAHIVHRDVNPTNILLSSSGEAKLADFGVVRMRSRTQASTLPGIVKGKFRYMAPEYITGMQCTLKTDVYSMGVTLYELLAGAIPLADLDPLVAMRIAVDSGLSVAGLPRIGVPPGLVAVVEQAIARAPEDRWTTAADMADALDAWLDQQPGNIGAEKVANYLVDKKLSRPEIRGMRRFL